VSFSRKKSIVTIYLLSFISLIVLVGAGFFMFWLVQKLLLPTVDLSDSRCDQTTALYMDASVPVSERVDDLLSKMTDWEKFGQMMMIEKGSIGTQKDISRYNLGALLSGGGSGPQNDTPEAWLEMTTKFKSTSADTCLKIPLLYAIDAVHGHANVLGATVFPHFMGLGATRDPDLVRRVADATAKELSATGIFWSFSPDVDVPSDKRWGKTFETFGSDTNNVATLGAAYVEGLQNSSQGYMNVLGSAKHYIGGGAMEYGTSRNPNYKIEEGNITLREEDLREIHLVPFQAAVDAGVQSVMVNTATWNGKMNMSNKYLLTDVLKGELGFSGLVISDWYGVYLVAPNRYDALVQSINAGIDMVMTPTEYKDFMVNMQKAVESGDISRTRIDDAVRRILTAKFNAGLFERAEPTVSGLSVIGSAEHRTIAREAVRKSLVELKNSKGALPISKNTPKILVAGSAADNLGRQAGGWTTEWQGIDGNFGIVGTTVLAAIKSSVSKNTQVVYDTLGDFPPQTSLADVGIVVVGDKPYAEGLGDSDNLSLSSEDLATIQKVKAGSKKVIVVIIAGRPLDIQQYSNQWDGIVTAWLPGSESLGITDVIFGDYPFTGSLPIEWPL
jgi:beta-glucosidase